MLNYCPNCGTRIEGEWNSCPYCGHNLQSEREISSPQQISAPISSYPQYLVQPPTIIYPPKQSNARGIVALIFGLLGLLILPFVGSIVAIIVGAVGRNKDENPGMATAGLVIGIIGFVLWTMGIAFIMTFMMSFFPPFYS